VALAHFKLETPSPNLKPFEFRRKFKRLYTSWRMTERSIWDQVLETQNDSPETRPASVRRHAAHQPSEEHEYLGPARR
jgi:hypothetical protein